MNELNCEQKANSTQQVSSTLIAFYVCVLHRLLISVHPLKPGDGRYEGANEGETTTAAISGSVYLGFCLEVKSTRLLNASQGSNFHSVLYDHAPGNGGLNSRIEGVVFVCVPTMRCEGLVSYRW